jgi:UDP-N-acetyl-D-mannosaminuronic acid dehydrogenase
MRRVSSGAACRVVEFDTSTLKTTAQDVLTTDPFVTTDPAIFPLEQVIDRSDILILCTPHSVYADADLKGKPVVDVWGFLKSGNIVA